MNYKVMDKKVRITEGKKYSYRNITIELEDLFKLGGIRQYFIYKGKKHYI